MTLELVTDAAGDPRNALALAAASDLAYLPQAEGAAAFQEQLGMQAQLFSVDNTQAYLAQNDQHLVVAFRGTESPTSIDGLKDWLLTNAVNFLVVPEGQLGTDLAAAGVGARYHQGFVKALGDIFPPLFAAVEAALKAKERPLWITGHSLGGALAQLAAWVFDRRSIPVHQVYTFGAPMIGNNAVAKAFDKAFPNMIFRYADTSDPIPKLPTVSLAVNDYCHCDKEVGVGAAAPEAGSALEYFGQMASKTANGLLSGTLVDDFWKGVVARVAYHSMENYRKRLTGS
ncbi:MAG: lipase family protein [Gemmataceae bacterium]|nr:lipase family protein [Gemmataceae bacterium]